MEKIKQALEKARGLRLSSDQPRTLTTATLPRRTIATHNLDNIVYTQTKVVQISEQILEENRIVAHTKSDMRSAHYDMLRTRVLQEMERNGWKTIAITSPTPACGKTVTAINLAFSISHKTGSTALLADFDLRRPCVAKYLGLPAGPSLVDYLEDDQKLEAVLINPGAPRLVVLPNIKSVANAAEVLASEKIASLVSELRDRYQERTVIFDLPPILTIDDATALLPIVDCVLLVTASGKTTASEIKESRRLLEDHNLLGIVLNMSDAKRVDYYY